MAFVAPKPEGMNVRAEMNKCPVFRVHVIISHRPNMLGTHLLAHNNFNKYHSKTNLHK